MHQAKRYKRFKALVVTVMLLPCLMIAQTIDIPFHTEPYVWESGRHDGNRQERLLAESHRVEVAGAPWLQLHFQAANLGEQSYITIRSLKDQAVERLDSQAMVESENYSAYFNGDVLEVKLYVAPNDDNVFLKLEEVVVGDYVPKESQCGPRDDRRPWNDRAVGRLSGGCTGWIIYNGNLVTAGHCGPGKGRNRIFFNVPISKPNGAVQYPGPQHQYNIDKRSVRASNGGVGNDWAVFRVFRNRQTGKFPIQVQRAAFRLKRNLRARTIRVTGYGVDRDTKKYNQTQQSHSGPNINSRGTTMRYRVDTEGGNSGSPVIDANGYALGVHTHGGCSRSGGGYNQGTATTNGAFWGALHNRRDSNGSGGEVAESGHWDDQGLQTSQHIPRSLVLKQNYPNPFNPSTQISYELPAEMHVKLTIYNMLGQEILTLVNGIQASGPQTAIWKGIDQTGQAVAGGVYLYRLKAGDKIMVKKMLLNK